MNGDFFYNEELFLHSSFFGSYKKNTGKLFNFKMNL